MQDELKVYTLNEVQGILKLTKRALYNYIKDGKLPARKMGKQWIVKHEDLKEFIDKGTSNK